MLSPKKIKVILRPAVSRPVRLCVRHPSVTPDQFLFLHEIVFRQLRVCYFVAPSLTRGRVCNLLLLLVLSSTVPLWSESGGTQDHILLPQFLRLRQPGGPGPRIYIPQEQGGPVILLGHWAPFPSPLMTRRATVEVFYPASTQVLVYVCLYVSSFQYLKRWSNYGNLMWTLWYLRSPQLHIFKFHTVSKNNMADLSWKQ
jgi:hypothetical protein